MRRSLNFVISSLALGTLLTLAASASDIAITHISIVDVRSGRIKPDMTVLIENDRITLVRPSITKEKITAKKTQVIDGRGKFLIPGLWDMHVHTDGDDRVLHLFIAYGITG